MKTTYNKIKRTYVKPELLTIELDNEISLILTSRVLPDNPEGGNYDSNNEHFSQIPFE